MQHWDQVIRFCKSQPSVALLLLITYPSIPISRAILGSQILRAINSIFSVLPWVCSTLLVPIFLWKRTTTPEAAKKNDCNIQNVAYIQLEAVFHISVLISFRHIIHWHTRENSRNPRKSASKHHPYKWHHRSATSCARRAITVKDGMAIGFPDPIRPWNKPHWFVDASAFLCNWVYFGEQVS